MCPCALRSTKSWTGSRGKAASRQSFSPGLPREAVVVTLPKVICRFSSKGLDALSTLNSGERLL